MLSLNFAFEKNSTRHSRRQHVDREEDKQQQFTDDRRPSRRPTRRADIIND